ncbi:hypothetical protein BDN72DRAFT_893936 [Pluteus cervinus]|uniref:Uncharacterized protein n=1 Tax=Pluteus cervinus TaxID=181527 RepID=A0ACD3B7B1_9AGAR|nr:hypothetical protein BDN72DRAFT_893936 [Pluteus cervinus]
MSRGGRGAGRGGGRGGRGGFGGSSAPLPMGLSHADIQALSREATALYPPIQVPLVTDYTEDEKRIAQLQIGFAERLKKSPYYIVEKTKSTGAYTMLFIQLPRYSDKYRPQAVSQPTLKRSDLHQPFFPKGIFEDYFDPKRKQKPQKRATKKLNLDELLNEEDQEKSSEERSDADSQAEASDYDVDEEYDNDYADNHFDNGEGDDLDNLDGGAADEGGGGGGDYD